MCQTLSMQCHCFAAAYVRARDELPSRSFDAAGSRLIASFLPRDPVYRRNPPYARWLQTGVD